MYCFNCSLHSTDRSEHLDYHMLVPETKHILFGNFKIKIAQNTQKLFELTFILSGNNLFLLNSDKSTRETKKSKTCLDNFKAALTELFKFYQKTS